MIFEPHKLFLVVGDTTAFDHNGDVIPDADSETWIPVCGCFLHDVTVSMMRGYAGTGISPKYYINLDRRDDLLLGQEVAVTEADGLTVRGRGEIVDIKRTGGMKFAGRGEYMTVYI
ncbi:MAG: hypothetical protein LBB90_10430 [Tannerella sp.]|jgi:hypothetical protein|nr:hypothetical protein [Tannerella sp.]